MLAALASKILFSSLKNKIHIFIWRSFFCGLLSAVPDTLTAADIETRAEDPTSSTIKLVWHVPRANGIITGYRVSREDRFRLVRF